MIRSLRQFGVKAYDSVQGRVRARVRNLGYEMDWRWWANPRSARAFATARPGLAAAQSQVVADLRNQGLARVALRDLFGNEGPAVWQTVRQSIADFVAEPRVQEQARTFREQARDGAWKQYVVKMFPDEPALVPYGHPLLQLATRREILDIVNTYLGLYARLNSVNAWYTVPAGSADRQRSASQQWHRDPEDRRLLKMFLYITDVDADSGALEYIPSTRTGGADAHLLRPTGLLAERGYNYPTPQLVEGILSRSNKLVGSGPAGTLVLCDTSGLHRGGFTVQAPRILGVWAWVTPACRSGRDYRITGAPMPLDPAVRGALA